MDIHCKIIFRNDQISKMYTWDKEGFPWKKCNKNQTRRILSLKEDIKGKLYESQREVINIME